MVYTESTKRKLDEILKAFGNYIREQDYFDIVSSEKIGYVIILAKHPGDAGAEQLDTPEKMLDVLFNEIILDVTNATEGKGCDADSSAPLAHEEAESRRRITAIVGNHNRRQRRLSPISGRLFEGISEILWWGLRWERWI